MSEVAGWLAHCLTSAGLDVWATPIQDSLEACLPNLRVQAPADAGRASTHQGVIQPCVCSRETAGLLHFPAHVPTFVMLLVKRVLHVRFLFRVVMTWLTWQVPWSLYV